MGKNTKGMISRSVRAALACTIIALSCGMGDTKTAKRQKREKKAKEFKNMDSNEQSKYVEDIDKQLDDLMSQMDDIQSDFGSKKSGKNQVIKAADLAKGAGKGPQSMNLSINYSHIMKYLIKNDSEGRDLDFMVCGLKLLINTFKSRYYEQFVFKLMELHGKRIENSEGKERFLVCDLVPYELNELRNMLGRDFELKDLLSGKKNYFFSSRIMLNLVNNRDNFLYANIVALHTMSNIFSIDVDLNFYDLGNEISSHFDLKKKDMAFNQIVNNQLTKCSYSKIFKKKVGFSYGDLLVLQKLGYYDSRGKDVSGSTAIVKKMTKKHYKGKKNFLGDGSEGEEAHSAGVVNLEKYRFFNSPVRNETSKISNKRGILKDFYWHLNYPIPSDTTYTHKKSNKICLKCKDSIILISNQFGDIVEKYSEFLEVDDYEYQITEKTKFKEEKKAGKRTDYVGMNQQMAGRGDANAALELAQDYYYGNDAAGVERDEEMAHRYYRDAAQLGDEWAVANYAIMRMNSQNETEKKEAVESLKKSAESGKGESITFSTLGYAYETGQGVEQNETEALKWYEKAAEKGSADGMANYALIVIQNMMTENFEKSYKFMKDCFNLRNNARCRYATATYILYDSLNAAKNKMNKTCEELLIYVNEGAISLQSKENLKKAKDFYSEGKVKAAIINLSRAYALGSVQAQRNLRKIIELKRTGSLLLASEKRNTFFIFDLFELIRAQNYYRLSSVADTIFYGFEFENRVIERYRNSFKYYDASWKINRDYYSVYSLAYMQQNGLGVDKNDSIASSNFFKVMNASVHGNIPKISLLPSSYGFLRILAKRVVKKVVRTSSRFLSYFK